MLTPTRTPRRRGARLESVLGVYSAQRDSALLGDVVEAETVPGDRVVDLCTGSGVLAVRAAHRCRTTVSAVDVSRGALLVARRTARRAGVSLRLRRGDLLDPVAGESFDLVVANPPYVPAREEDLPRRGRRRAWDGGVDGRSLVDRICRTAPHALAPGGRLLLVQSEFTGVEQSRRLLEEQGMTVDIAARCEHPFGPVLTRRAAHLERAGLLEPGRRYEELVVLRARAA